MTKKTHSDERPRRKAHSVYHPQFYTEVGARPSHRGRPSAVGTPFRKLKLSAHTTVPYDYDATSVAIVANPVWQAQFRSF